MRGPRQRSRLPPFIRFFSHEPCQKIGVGEIEILVLDRRLAAKVQGLGRAELGLCLACRAEPFQGSGSTVHQPRVAPCSQPWAGLEDTIPLGLGRR